MSLRKIPFVNNEIYHIYNRGTDKRIVFQNESDYKRFLDSVIELNTKNPFGGLYLKSFLGENNIKNIDHKNKLVEIIAYCLNPNHFHLMLRQFADNGISKFMQRLGTGYTLYFNNQNRRNGSLFQGKFKSIHVDTNEYLIYLSTYINLNDKIHGIDNGNNFIFSSLKEYVENINGICEKSVILDQYKDKNEYKKFLLNSLPELLRQKKQKTELEKYFLE